MANIGRPNNPAVSKRGKSESQEELKQRAQREANLKGGSSKLHELILTPRDHLSDEAQGYFKFIATELENADILSNLDIPLLEMTATCLANMKEADRLVQENELLVFDNDDDAVGRENPMVKTYHSYANQFRQLSSQLGLSPSSRAYLASLEMGAEKVENDPLLQAFEQQREATRELANSLRKKKTEEENEDGDE